MLKLLTDSESPRQRRLQMLAVAALMLILCALSYGPALHAPLYWDDSDWLTENPAVKHSNISWIWTHHRSTDSYYPLTLTSFWAEYKIWGAWLPGYRAVNILLHAASAFLLWRILAKVKVPGALLAAIVWAVHPIQAESVVWITERKNTLSGIFFFAGLLTWLKVLEPQMSRQKKIAMYVVTLILLAAALLAKGSTVFFPVAALGLAWLYAGKLRRRDVLLSIPLFIAAAAMAVMTMYFEYYYASSGYGEEWNLTLAQRVILSGHCFWFYIEKMLWPNDLAFLYQRWELRVDAWAEYLPVIAAAALMLALGVLAWRKKWHAPFIGMVIFVAGIFPVIGFFRFYTQILTYVADHYAYLGSAAFLSLIVGLLAFGWQKCRERATQMTLPTWLAPTASVVLVVVLTTLSCGQSLLYRSFLAAWQETLRITPSAWIAYNAVGEYLYKNEYYAEALASFEAGLKGNRDPRLLTNAGLSAERLKRPDLARGYYQEAVDKNVRFFAAYVNLALIELRAGHAKEAAALCEKGVQYNEFEPMIWFVMGDAYRADQQLEKAAGAYIHGLQLAPNKRGAHLVLGDVAYQLGKYPEAVDLYTQAAERDPDNAHIRMNLAAALRKVGREQEAQAMIALGRTLEEKAAAATQQAK